MLRQRGHDGKGIVQELELSGLRGTLTPEQWKEFRRRGVRETLIVYELDENGMNQGPTSIEIHHFSLNSWYVRVSVSEPVSWATTQLTRE
jgi:hypothetical protein